MKKTILLTNDDGIFASGLKALEKELQERSMNFFVVAPLSEKSGVGHSITLHQPLRIKRFLKNRYAVDGTPADSVFLALSTLMDSPPNLIISGMNKGGNLGEDLFYSGTFAAASEGFLRGITSVAVSLYFRDFRTVTDETFKRATEIFFSQVIPFIESSLGEESFYKTAHLLNVNIPEVALNQEVPLIEWSSLGKRIYGAQVVERVDPRGAEYFWIGGDQHGFADIPGSDCNAIQNGRISVTPISMGLSDDNLLKHLLEKNNEKK